MNTKSFDRDGNREFLADKRIAIIVADFYKDIADNLLNSSIETIEHYGCKLQILIFIDFPVHLKFL